VLYCALLVGALLLGATSMSSGDLLPIACFIAGALVLTRHEIELERIGVSGEALLIIIGACLFGPAAVFIGAAALGARFDRSDVRLFNGAAIAVPGAIAGCAAWALGDSMLIAVTVAAALMSFTNVLMVAWFMSVGFGHPFRGTVTTCVASVVATTIFCAPIAAGVVALHDRFGFVALVLTLVPLSLAQYFLTLYQRKVQLTDELAEKAQVLARTNLQFAAAMVKALDARDAYTAGHSAAVAVYTRDIAKEMGFDDETVRLAHLAGLLHDIGKIGVPGRVLNKTAPLDDEEYELMKTHAAMGAEILGEVDLYADIAILVRYHHERIDGRGYPDGISGDAIPAISRMISVADTYSAMTTDRPYREGMPTEKAMSILRECRGTQLDQDFTDAFLRILIVADEAYQRGKQTDFEVEVAKHQALSEVEAEAVRLNEPAPAGPAAPDAPMLPAAVDGELVEVDLEREAA
jgi:putative nucleotidyltransferase with HDIG domain